MSYPGLSKRSRASRTRGRSVKTRTAASSGTILASDPFNSVGALTTTPVGNLAWTVTEISDVPMTVVTEGAVTGLGYAGMGVSEALVTVTSPRVLMESLSVASSSASALALLCGSFSGNFNGAVGGIFGENWTAYDSAFTPTVGPVVTVGQTVGLQKDGSHMTAFVDGVAFAQWSVAFPGNTDTWGYFCNGGNASTKACMQNMTLTAVENDAPTYP